MSQAWQFFLLCLPLFALVLAGYLIASWRWRRRWTEIGSQLIFNVAMPAMLFHLMMTRGGLPPADGRLLLAFFGSCFVVFALGRMIAARYFKLDGVGQSVFALGGVFSNNVLLGVPIARMTLGEQSMPMVALVLVFNALILWTLVSVSVEWARHGSLTLQGFGKTTLGLARNPIIMSIVAGAAGAALGIELPALIEQPLGWLSALATPGTLLVLGMGLTEYDIQEGLDASLAICALKLVAQPLIAWLLAWMMGLPPLETSVVVLLAALSVGVNVYMMATQFQTLRGTVASALVLSTAIAAFTVPMLLAAVRWASG